MAEIPDNLGRVGNFKDSNFDSLAEDLRSAVGKAVEYAAGRAKENQDEIKKDFDRLVEAMEELGDDIKENLKSAQKFVDEVKGAAETMGKRKESAKPDSFTEAQREQTRVLQMILRSHQKAVGEKSAKFTSGGTVLASPPTRKSTLKEMGFKPRGTDKIPAMLSPNEFIVNSKGTAGNENLLNSINRGYVRGGKVKPEYRAGGDLFDRVSEILGGRRHRVEFDAAGNATLVVDGTIDPDTHRRLKEEFARFGHDSAEVFAEDFNRHAKSTMAKWLTGLGQVFTGKDPFQVLFEGGVKDITMFRREMRELAYESQGLTGEFREAQAEFAKIGDNIVGRTGTSVTAFQNAYMKNARKGFKDQKAAMRVLESGLKTSTLIGSEAQATSTLFADWHRDLNLGAVQMDRMANNMQMVAKRTGMTGDELVGVMKSSEQILKNLRKQGTLTTTAARNIIQSMAEFKKQGFEEEGQKTLAAMSGYSAFTNADEGTKRLLSISADHGGVAYRDLMFGNVPQDQEKMGKMGEGLKDFLASSIKIDPKDFDFDMLTRDQREQLSIILEGQGSSLGAAEATMQSFAKIQSGLGGSLAELDKIRKSSTATDKQKAEAEKKMNDQLLSSSMDMLQSVTQVTEKYGDKSLAEVSKLIDEKDKFREDFETGSRDMATIATQLSSATQNQFGLSGTAEQMEKQIASMGRDKQVQLRSIAAAEQLDKTMAAKGSEPKDFAKRMQEALAKGDTAKFKTITEEMGAAFSESQIDDATGVDPMTKLEQTMQKLNETIRKYMGGFVGSILDFIGHFGMLAVNLLAAAGSLHHMIDKDLIGGIKDLGLGTKLKEFAGGKFAWGRAILAARGDPDATGKALAHQIRYSFSTIVGPTFGRILQKSLGPAVLLLGGIKGVMESKEAKRTKTEGFILGALTGGAKTGSFLSPMLGVKEGSGTDKAMGVAGAAAWGATAGAAISLSLGGIDLGASIVIGAVIGAFMEIVKIVTEGTDILQDLFKPFQVVVDYVYDVCKGIYDIFAGIFTLDIGRALTGVVDIIGSTIMVIPRLILGAIQMVIIGLPKLIFRALAMIAEIPGMIFASISRALVSLGDNQWVGPIFKTLSAIFEPIREGVMAIWTPIAALFRGLYRVFDDLGKALFGASSGGSMLGGIMWVLQKAIWGLSYVISWILSPIILVAKILGFVLKVIGSVISGIVGFFKYLYDTLVGHSIVPDLVFGIIKFFAMLPVRIMGFLLEIPSMIGRAFSNIGSYFQGFEGDGILATLMRQLGSFFSFIGSTFGNLVNMASGILTVITGILSLDFGQVWEGLKTIGSSIIAQIGNVGTLLWNVFSNSVSFLFSSLKKLPKLFMKLFTAVFVKFPTWLFGLLKDALVALPGILVQGIKFVFLDLPKYLWEGFKSSLSKVWEWIKSWVPKSVTNAAAAVTSTAEEQRAQRDKEGDSLLHAGGGLVGSVYHLLGAAGRALQGDFKTAGSNLSTAGGKVVESGKEAGSYIGSGLSSTLSWLNPASYFKEGTKKIKKPGLGVLHEGEMVVPKSVVDQLAALGTGAFGGLSSLFGGKKTDGGDQQSTSGLLNKLLSFFKGNQGEDSGQQSLFASLRDRISGLGDSFKSCCPEGSDAGADGLGGEISEAMSAALGDVDDSSFFGKIRKKFALANSQVSKFFKPMTTGFLRARKKGEGFIGSVTKGLKSQYMSMTKGGVGESLSRGMGWIEESIFGKKEASDTKKGIFQRIKEGIFGGKEGEDTKKGILGIIKDGLFGSGDDVKKGLFQIAKEGLFGKEGEGGGILGWIKGKVFGQKMAEGEMGPPKPGLVDSLKSTATSFWESMREKVQENAEEGIIGKAKGVVSGVYGKAKEKLFGQKMAEGEMGPPKPGLLERVKSKAGGLYGKAKEKLFGQKMAEGEMGPPKPSLLDTAKAKGGELYGRAKEKVFGQKMAEGEMGPPKPGLLEKAKSKAGDLYGKAKEKVFGKDASERLKSVGKADEKTRGDFSSFKEKMKNIAEGIKQFADMKVLGGALNLIPTSVGLVAMIPGTVGARLIAGIDGEKLKTSLVGLASGIKEFGSLAVTTGAANLIPASIGLTAMIPGALGARLLSSLDGNKLRESMKGLADGISEMGKMKVLIGAAALAVVGVASLALLPAIPMFAMLGMLAPLIQGGLNALGQGLTAFGQAAMNPYTWLGVLLLGALGVIMIPFAYALSLLSPLVEAFGKAIKSAFEGMGSVLKAAGEGISMILKEITMSKALALGVAALGIGALGVAMAAFAAGGFIASWVDFFSGNGVFNKIMALGAMGPKLLMAATGVDILGKSFRNFAANKSGGWKEWFTGNDGVIEGFKKLSKIGTPEFKETAESIQKMADGMEKMQKIRSIPMPMIESGDATTATTAPAEDQNGVAEVEPVHLRDIGGTILRDRAGSGGNKLQSDELSRIEEVSYRQVSELEQIKQGIQELVSLMKPKGSSVVGSGEEVGAGSTRDPRRPTHAVRFGKMKYGKIGGNANRSFVNNGES